MKKSDSRDVTSIPGKKISRTLKYTCLNLNLLVELTAGGDHGC